mmetsp:Transcript_95453/g.189210  ORF Transcript_95453/g.189210 Transcript_95453/m.189210 type:complete len:105 (-) Transcript_95453:1113-1427(-)
MPMERVAVDLVPFLAARWPAPASPPEQRHSQWADVECQAASATYQSLVEQQLNIDCLGLIADLPPVQYDRGKQQKLLVQQQAPFDVCQSLAEVAHVAAQHSARV